MTYNPSARDIDARWTAVIILTLSSVAATLLLYVFVHVSEGADLYIAITPIGISLMIALLSVWASKVLVEEAHRRAEEHVKMLKLESELELTQRARELHHDLVNHLTAVSSWIQLGAGDRATRYIHQILGTSQSAKTLSSYSDSSHVALLLGMIGQKISKADELGVALSFHVDSEWGRSGVADEVVVRILGNLADNALDAATRATQEISGRVEIHASAQSSGAVFRVWNNGPAIPEGVLRRIREGGARPQTTEERGWGLHIVRRLVREYDGTLEVHSDAASGTEFRVWFPNRKDLHD